MGWRVLRLSVNAPRALGRGDQSMEGCEFVVGLSMARRFEQNRTEQNIQYISRDHYPLILPLDQLWPTVSLLWFPQSRRHLVNPSEVVSAYVFLTLTN